MRAETTPLKSGMAVTAQNYSGSVEKDRFGFIDKLDGYMSAGFYYKRGHKPYSMWPFVSRQIRKMAGTGVVDVNYQPDSGEFHELYPNAEVCVLGGGPAGLSAAIAAAEQGLRVILFDARPWLGGFYGWRVKENASGTPLYQRAAELAAKAEALPNLRIFGHSFVTNLHGDNLVTAFQVGGEDDQFIQRYIQVRPNSVVVATGCGERPLIFENNERPGVMQAACAWRLARTYGILAGTSAVFSVADDLGLEAADDLASQGMRVLAVADARIEGADAGLVDSLRGRGVEYLPGWAASEAQGKPLVTGAVLGAISGSGSKTLACDLLVASAGLSPVSGPLSTVGAKFGYDPHSGFFRPNQLPPRVHAAGRLLGYTDAEAIEASGVLAGMKAAADCGKEAPVSQAQEKLDAQSGIAKGSGLVHGPNIGEGRKSFVCFDEDGTFKTARQSVVQGFDVPELAKRFGGFGLGPGQGGIPGHNLPLVMAELRGEKPDAGLMPTTVRSPLVPTLMATLAGPGHDIFKRTPMQAEQEKLGAVLRRVGVWKRARYFSSDETCAEEIKAVRAGVGLIDVSTLGKFRLHGPDAEKVLQRVYISDMSKTPVGKMKYSAMLNDDGMLIDDGVVTKLGDNDYYFTTSTGRAGATIEWMRYQARFEGWDFHLVNLTDGLAAVNLAGPLARKVLAKITGDDVSNEAFPFMGYRELDIKGELKARAMRVGFVGELSYELHYPASFGAAVWNWLMEAGGEFGIKPFGLEAQFCCRLEKGHVIIGQESEQRTNLLDLGMGFLWAKNDTASKKVGAPALKFTKGQAGRFRLVGFVMPPEQKPGDGSIVYEGDKIQGFVCSCRRSFTLGQTIGMAIVKEHLAKEGGELQIYQNDSNQPLYFKATVKKPPFYDPEGEKLHA